MALLPNAPPTYCQPNFSLLTTGTIVKVCNARVLGMTYCTVNAGTSIIADGSNSVYDTGDGSADSIYGNITVTNGGTAKFQNLRLYASAGANSSLEIGPNSLITASAACPLGYLSADGTATVHISRGGTFKNLLSTAETSIKTNATVTLDTGGVFSAYSSTTRILNYGGVLQGSGLVTGAFYNATATGFVRPGGTNQAGALTFSGSYNNGDTNPPANPPGTLDIELGGTNTVQFDRLVVSGSLAATGTVSVALINGFKPSNGDRFKILDFSSVSGTFDTLNLPGGARRWDTSNLYNTGEIRYILPAGTIVLIH